MHIYLNGALHHVRQYVGHYGTANKDGNKIPGRELCSRAVELSRTRMRDGSHCTDPSPDVSYYGGQALQLTTRQLLYRGTRTLCLVNNIVALRSVYRQ